MASPNNRLVSKEYLEEHYTLLGKSASCIAKQLGCTSKVIMRLLKLYNIPLNPQHDPNNNRQTSLKDRTGELFGQVRLIKLSIKKAKGQVYWDGECIVCGHKICMAIKDLKKVVKEHRLGCVKCSRKQSKNSGWTGYEDIKGEYWRSIINSASKRSLEFNITIEYAWNIFLKQERKCALTNISLILYGNGKDRTASLDRIDNTKGYIEGNVQWVYKDVNYMKWTFTTKHFINLCTKVVETNKNKEFIPSDFMLGI